MAPKRKKKTTEAPRGSDAATLIAQCPRAALEELALRMFDQPGSVSRKDLEEAAAACRPKAPKVISVGDDRKGTGAFDVVNGDVLARILLALPIQDRYRIAICVCKAWRRLRSAHGLFTVIRAGGFDAGARRTWRKDALRIGPWQEHAFDSSAETSAASSLGLHRLVQWHAHRDEVHTLSLATSCGTRSYLSADAVIAAIKDLPKLRTLALNGKSITAKVMKARPPCLATLKMLAVGNGCSGSPAQFAAMLGAAPKLESLAAADKLCTAQSLGAAVRQWRAARGGGDPLLAHLYLCGYDHQNFALINQLGNWLPNLETLAFRAPAYQHVWMLGAPQFSTFQRLHTLRIEGMAGYQTHASTEQIEQLTAAALSACPKLETLQMLHGVAFSRPPPIPGAGTAFRTLPPTLKYLAISDIVLDSESLSVNSLEVLRLNNCNMALEAAQIFWPDLAVEDFEGTLARIVAPKLDDSDDGPLIPSTGGDPGEPPFHFGRFD